VKNPKKKFRPKMRLNNMNIMNMKVNMRMMMMLKRRKENEARVALLIMNTHL
jgi:hypothetical protein